VVLRDVEKVGKITDINQNCLIQVRAPVKNGPYRNPGRRGKTTQANPKNNCETRGLNRKTNLN